MYNMLCQAVTCGIPIAGLVEGRGGSCAWKVQKFHACDSMTPSRKRHALHARCCCSTGRSDLLAPTTNSCGSIATLSVQFLVL
jgi:hypothetical protein